MAKTPSDAGFWDPADLLHAARTADPQSAWSAFNVALTKAGFENSFFAFGVPINSKRALLDKFDAGIFGGGRVANEFFPELVRRPDLLAQDPVAPHCQRSLTPFVWSCTDMKPGDQGPLPLAYDFDLRSFMVFPLRNGDATRYGNFTVYCEDARHKSWLKHAHRFAPLLHVTAQFLHDSLAGLDAAPPGIQPVALSPRQRECLLWASRGYSTKKIADRLFLSEPVVNEYLRSAKQKLGCATRTHAVARAIRLDLIKP